MEVESWKIDILKPCRRIERVKPGQDALVHFGINPAGSSGLEMLGQTLVPERPDYGTYVSILLT
jgi:hypothetical protein